MFLLRVNQPHTAQSPAASRKPTWLPIASIQYRVIIQFRSYPKSFCVCYPNYSLITNHSSLLILKYGVTVFACADTPGVDHVAHEDTTVADLTRMGRF